MLKSFIQKKNRLYYTYFLASNAWFAAGKTFKKIKLKSVLSRSLQEFLLSLVRAYFENKFPILVNFRFVSFFVSIRLLHRFNIT